MTSRRLAIVIGGSGGIGRALAQRLSDDTAYDHVLTLSRRRPEGWDDSLRRSWFPADILDEESLDRAARHAARLGAPSRILVATGRLHGAGLAPEKTMRSLDLAALTALFATNAAGPALAAKHFLPLTPRDQPSVFAALSARVGSIGDNQLGGWYGYRAAKAALNMLIHTLAIEHRRTRPLGLCVALHPGTVDTDLSAPFQSGVAREALFSPDQSAENLLAVLEGLRAEHNGGFFAWDGTPVPW
ncbi:MAG: SDR family NAD(P)-dependent oxidoreductase [Phenylobacterium sp.]|uniref:SDR family NAD(P)-dependent oxidoreductase n=1 Tax=Phenylobacterium sp. TaxID=1871053 RepID=UPI001B55703D|nr:SDR family NAD(P)-dependent oxidoreductase [Phenylobacterium sp.]MBP7648531.1 SDR family NAD(P)-dependent oxidoreductase [Phenylobacterium sp.]MBP7815908.1 SDR family NAD(P)-dependent oxidoreductase [Phenylobacterium sp.]